MKNRDIEQAAWEIAFRAHKGQTRDDNNEPYINHPCKVAKTLENYFPNDSALIASGFCHDVLEDCPQISEAELMEAIGKEAFYIVKECTNPSKQYPDLPRHERKEMDRNHIKHISEKAKYLKLADRTDNLTDTCNSLDKEWARTYVKESMALYTVLQGTHYELEMKYLEALVKAAKSCE
jgi:guanosine-3',5'-bis(diphosphate) 3'-pyrophosphohydrolase